jgi:hypothetical protein
MPMIAVMRGLDPRIHVVPSPVKTWMAEPSPAMTVGYVALQSEH